VKILLDHNLDWRLFRSLPDHEVKSTLKMGWAGLENGDLLDAAEKAAFAVMLTADKNIKKQQTIAGRSIALIVLRAPNNKLQTHIPMMQEANQALLTIEAGQVVEIFHPDLKPKHNG
jgi:predicted nuclease of predicted toxin-antitoxin system